MNILMIGHFVPFPLKSGALQRSFYILRELSKNNTVNLLALNQKALLPDDKSLNESITVLENYCKTIKVFQIPSDKSKISWYMLLFFNLFSILPYSVKRFKSAKLKNEIKKRLQSTHFDLIYMDTIDLAQYAILSPDLPKILNHHNLESSLLFRRAENARNPLTKLYLYLQAWKTKRYEIKLVKIMDVNLTVSDIDKRDFLKLAPDSKFRTVPNGTDTEYFVPQKKEDNNKLIFVGGMGWYPNKDAMMYFCEKILPILKEKRPTIEIGIIGNMPPKELKNLANIDDSIKLLGFVDDIRDYVSEAAAFVVPLRVGGGTRLKILDAFSSGKAVVSTSIGCEGLEVTPGEDILIGDTATEFASKIIDVLSDDELRIRLETNGRKLAEEKYSWIIIGKTINSIFRDVYQN